MPIVNPTGARVLVTGANGFIAMWTIRSLLEKGYGVRGVVRSLDKGKHLKEYFSSYGDKLELFVVEDMMKDGAFDEAVKGVDAIEHMATPVNMTGIEPDEYIQPAIRGTVGILESALKFGDQVKRIVITSSAVAIYNPVKEPFTIFDESHWADSIVNFVKEKGKEAGPLDKYSASKTLAEKAAWEFYNTYKDQAKWDLVVLNPPFVLGPPLYQVLRPEDLNVSLLIFWNRIIQDLSADDLKNTYAFVDVRDVATAHVTALSKEEAGDQRIIISNGASTWQETRDFIYSLQPELYDSAILSRGIPGLYAPLLYTYNNEKGKRVLGIKYTSREQTITDLLADFKERGWLEKRTIWRT